MSSYTARFTHQLNLALAAQFPANGVTTPGLGYIAWATPSMGNMSILPITMPNVPQPSTSGIGRHAFELSTVDHKVTLTNVQTNRLFLVLTKKSGGGIGYYKVDGGAAVAFDSFNASTVGGQLVNITLTSGVHSVEVGWSSGGIVTFNGFMVFNGDASVGVTVVPHGASSTQTNFWLDATTQNHWDNLKTFTPSLMIITDMRNDWSGGVPSATVKANLTAMIGKINGQYAADKLPTIVLCAEILDALGTAPIEPWSNYVAKAKQLENEQSNVLVFDMAPPLR
ncbi:SGNH/GDSL hydrolase family protein [Arthrobacter sp. B1I2]|uniref:SGNH/GDSL hydrolase family protein n=1 Tax=Arthrobacter sp. B1I2 TaxID=3042263 RepID=UPI0027D78D76|nr:SGNH/GDSL hydrolase family protein [Arthrobacter sp. B1I2]